MNKEKDQIEKVEIQRFQIENVLTTVQLSKMSKKDLHRHIEYLEQVALGLDNALVLTIEQLNKKVRAINGELV